jgi:hypothetical protein
MKVTLTKGSAMFYVITTPDNVPMRLPDGTTYREALSVLEAHSSTGTGTFTLWRHNPALEGGPIVSRSQIARAAAGKPTTERYPGEGS